MALRVSVKHGGVEESRAMRVKPDEKMWKATGSKIHVHLNSSVRLANFWN